MGDMTCQQGFESTGYRPAKKSFVWWKQDFFIQCSVDKLTRKGIKNGFDGDQ